MKHKISMALILVLLLSAPIWAKGPDSTGSTAGLTVAEKANIVYLFEEEKVAHDVYIEMYNLHGAFIFDNISESEQSHMNAVANLIIKYGLDDAVLNNGHGVFNDTLLQAEYDRLISEGKEGLIAALDVGIQIEEMDIEDLESMMAETNKTDIKRVMTNLLNGSNSHLTAFETQIGYIIQ